MSGLSELIERVEKLSGPDREVDAAIAEHFHLKQITEQWPDWCIDPPFTASLDAAVALVERAVPLMWRSIEWAGTNRPPSEWPVVEYGIGDFKGKVQAKTAPIALVLATLRALAQERSDG